jgi:hypothetical protein
MCEWEMVAPLILCEWKNKVILAQKLIKSATKSKDMVFFILNKMDMGAKIEK